MVTNGEWDKVNPKDTKIIALASKIKKLECIKGGKIQSNIKAKVKTMN